MWLQFLENPKIIQSIYEDEIPLLDNIKLQEVKIISGVDIQINLKVKFNRLPKNLPVKWLERNVNAVQIEWVLINSQILFFETFGDELLGNLEISLNNEIKRVSFKANKKQVFMLECKWLSINSINGYTEDLSSSQLSDTV